MAILPHEQLEPLLDKLSGYAKPDERIPVLARYHHLKPEALAKAATRWPKLDLEFMTIHASKGSRRNTSSSPVCMKGVTVSPPWRASRC